MVPVLRDVPIQPKAEEVLRAQGRPPFFVFTFSVGCMTSPA